MERLDASTVVYDFVMQHVQPKESRFQRDQFADVMSALGKKAADVAVAEGEDDHQLRKRLETAYDILAGIQFSLKSMEVWSRPRLPANASEEEIEERVRKEEEENRNLWRRRNPLNSFKAGTDSPDYINLDREGLAVQAARYLEQDWMSLPILDYIIVDALVTNELCAYGEAMKRDIMKFPRDAIGMNKVYYENKGDLRKMRSMKDGDGWNRIGGWLLFLLGPPILAAYLYEYATPESAEWVFTAYLWIAGPVLALKAISWIVRKARGTLTPEEKAGKLWGEMHEVWRLLDGPIINPTMVRDELHKTRQQGAVWDTVIYSIVDRAVARDPAVWSTLLPK